jgi:hypothetical protein
VLSAYVLWKTLAQLCQRTGLEDEPRKVLGELSQIALVDVALPTRKGVTIRKRCISRPTEHQAILLQRLWAELALFTRKYRSIVTTWLSERLPNTAPKPRCC